MGQFIWRRLNGIEEFHCVENNGMLKFISEKYERSYFPKEIMYPCILNIKENS